jgi:hypothetical protein
MPPQTNPFPRSRLSDVFDVIANALQADPVLARAVNVWQIWDGSDESLAEPSDADMPFLRMTPDTGASSWLDENAHQLRWPIRFELGVSGTDVRQLIDFWDCLRVALFTGNTVLKLLYPYQVVQKTLTSPATKPQLWGEATGLMGVATLSILLRLDS